MLRGSIVVCVLACLGGTALADRDMCAPDVEHRGKTIDLDLKDADMHDLMRLIGDVAKINFVVSDEVQAKVTVHLKRVAWDRAVCAIAATHRLSVMKDGNIILVMPQSAPKR